MDLPVISIVTPSFNQARFLGETMESVLSQNYPKLEYLVVDGGSRDDSVEIIRRHAARLSWWVSEPDGGMYDAINKGFAHSTGEIMAWLNSDDRYFPWTLSVVGELFATFPEIEWITTNFPAAWDSQGRLVNCVHADPYRSRSILRGRFLPGGGWFSRSWIQQESTFWRRSLWERAGGRLNTQYPLAADFELWLRFAQHASLVGVDTLLGGFRVHPDQQSRNRFEQYWAEAEAALREHGSPGSKAYGFLRNGAERAWQRLVLALTRSPDLEARAAAFSPGAGKWSLRRR